MLKIELGNIEERETVSTHKKFIIWDEDKTYTDERNCMQDYNNNTNVFTSERDSSKCFTCITSFYSDNCLTRQILVHSQLHKRMLK